MNRDAFDRGLKTRREVLGAEYVERLAEQLSEQWREDRTEEVAS